MADPTITLRQPPTPAPARRRSRLLITLFKIAVAVVGIWLVLRGVTWNDSATLSAGQSIRGITFPDEVTVAVLSQSPALPNGNEVIRIQFATRPLKMRVETRNGARDVEMPVDEDIRIPGT